MHYAPCFVIPCSLAHFACKSVVQYHVKSYCVLFLKGELVTCVGGKIITMFSIMRSISLAVHNQVIRPEYPAHPTVLVLEFGLGLRLGLRIRVRVRD